MFRKFRAEGHFGASTSSFAAFSFLGDSLSRSPVSLLLSLFSTFPRHPFIGHSDRPPRPAPPPVLLTFFSFASLKKNGRAIEQIKPRATSLSLSPSPSFSAFLPPQSCQSSFLISSLLRARKSPVYLYIFAIIILFEDGRRGLEDPGENFAPLLNSVFNARRSIIPRGIGETFSPVHYGIHDLLLRGRSRPPNVPFALLSISFARDNLLDGVGHTRVSAAGTERGRLSGEVTANRRNKISRNNRETDIEWAFGTVHELALVAQDPPPP